MLLSEISRSILVLALWGLVLGRCPGNVGWLVLVLVLLLLLLLVLLLLMLMMLLLEMNHGDIGTKTCEEVVPLP